MARVGYCRHNAYVGHGENYRPCMECEREAAESKRREEARIEEIRRIVREELAAQNQNSGD